MPYVMVPVPEEHEKEFQSELLQLSLRASLTAFDPEQLRGLVAELDPVALSFVARLVEASSANKRLTRAQVADAAGLDVLELLAIADRINHHAAERSQPALILVAPGPNPALGEAGEVVLITQVAARMIEPLLADG